MNTIRPPVLLLLLLIFAAAPLPLQAQFTEHDHYEEIVVKVELGQPGGSSEILTFQGAAEMEVFFEGSEGEAVDDDLNGREEVPTLFADLDGYGVSPSVGPLRLTMSTSIPSSGFLEEVVNNTHGWLDVPPFTVDGQLDVVIPSYFDLELVNLFGATLHNVQPQPLTGVFNHKPATWGDLLTSDQITELYFPAGEPSGWWFRIVYCLLFPIIENDDFESVSAELELRDPSGTMMIVDLEGSAHIQAIFEGATEGVATDDDDDGQDEIDTEIVALNLTGSSEHGTIILTENLEADSDGSIEETLNWSPSWLDIPPFTTPGSADSFFDVHIDLTVGTQFMRTRDACRITGTVTHKPAGPGDELHGEELVALENGAGDLTGWQMRLNVLRLVPGSSTVGGDPVPRRPAPYLTAAPNPFNPRVRIGVVGAAGDKSVLRVFDARGRVVATLFEGTIDLEETVIFWDGRDHAGQMVASGPYFLRLETTAGVAGKRVLLVR